jgi:hypothetical protein
MAYNNHDLLGLLKFELNFLEEGGYGPSARTPWRCQLAFEDSPTCPNFGEPGRTHSCAECLLMKFVPSELKDQRSPCRLIPLNDKGETIDYLYRCGTQLELEETLAGWLRKQISRMEEQHEVGPEAELSKSTSNGIDLLRQQQGLAMAENLWTLANLHREAHDYRVAHALYGHALAAAEKFAGFGDRARSLVARIRMTRQAVFQMVHDAARGSEETPAIVSVDLSQQERAESGNGLQL